MDRYSLIKNNGFNNQNIVKIPVESKEKIKSSLREIDEFTTQYENSEELLDSIKSGQIKLEDVEKLKAPKMYLKSYNKLAITYKQCGQMKETGVLYKRNSWVKDTKMVDNSKVDIRDPYFRRVYQEFVSICASPGGYDFFIREKCISLKVSEYVEKMIYDRDYSDFNKQKLMEHMSTYKQYRDIILGIKEYREIQKLEMERSNKLR